MGEIKKIDYDAIKEIVTKHGFSIDLILKDYYITIILYLIKDIEGIYSLAKHFKLKEEKEKMSNK